MTNLARTRHYTKRGSAKRKHITLFIFVIIFLLTQGCGRKETPQPGAVKERPAAKAENAEKDTVQHKVLAFNLEGLTEKGTKNWEVTGKTAEAISDHEVKLNDIVAKSYGKDAEATIVADEGVYDKSKNNVRLEKNVKATIENVQGMAGSFVDLPAEVTAKAGKEKKPDSGEKAKKEIVITCDAEVQFEYEKNMVYFNKNVKVTSPDGTIEADRITVNLLPDTKKVRDIVADGNVKIVRGQNITYSEKATYVEADKKVILTGNPKIIIPQEGNTDIAFLNR